MKLTLQHKFATALLCLAGFTAQAQTSWLITGNSNIAGTNFLGTTNSKPVAIRTNNVERLRILANGNVGIGTTAPTYKLQVAGGTYGIYGSGSTYGVVGSGSYGVYGSGSSYGVYGTSSSSYGVFGTSGYLGVYGTGGSYGVYGYSSSGYGVTGSSGYLGVYGTGTTYGLYGSGGSYGLYAYASASSGGYGAYGYNTGGSGLFGYNGGYGYGVGSYCENGSGVYGYSKNYVGVWGATGNSSSYAGYFAGNVYCTGSYLGSDRSLKQNIKEFNSAMSIINKLKPLQYEFRHDGNYDMMNLPTGSHYGLIAQDVESVLPNLVKETQFETNMGKRSLAAKPDPSGKPSSANTAEAKGETINFKAVNYVELIPIMIKAMQEQQTVIENQQKEIDELKNVVSLSKNTGTSNTAVSKTADYSSGAYVKQNAPNPFSQNTAIQYYIPSTVKQAQLIVYGMDGSQIKSYTLKNGMNQVSISGGTLSSGQYIYSLVVDGKKIDSKNMVLTK